MMMMMHMDSNSNIDESQESKLGRKLRPLMPRPIYSSPSCYIQNPNILLSISDEYCHGVKQRELQSKKAAPLVSTRWNPTAEQLQALEEMYRRGIRTPSAEQIQQIAAKLRRFGKIEGKNVFYWFQNYKARERQKKRRQLDLLAGKKMHHCQTQSQGISRRSFQIEHHGKVSIPSNCTTQPSKDSASMHGAVVAAECGKNGWKLELPKVAIATSAASGWQFDPSSSTSSSSSLRKYEENTEPVNHENQTTLELFPSPTSPPPHPPQQHIIHNFRNAMPTRFIEFLPIRN